MIWLKIVMVSLTSIIPTAVISLFIILMIQKTLKKELSRLYIKKSQYSKNKEPSKKDEVFFLIVYLLLIPSLLVINKYPLFIGIPIILGGIYGVILGRLISSNVFPFMIYYTEEYARSYGIIQITMGLIISILANAVFPLSL
jgi:hypothetical protein